jgi:hypothetical protein
VRKLAWMLAVMAVAALGWTMLTFSGNGGSGR